MGLFFTVILPIISVFIVGFILQRVKGLHIKSISSLSIYILTPALVFTSLYKADFNASYMTILIYMFALFYAMVLLNKIIAKIFKWNKKVESASILATGFMNSGNYGLPVVLFSLGEKALPYAIFIMVIQSLQNNFFGVYYASRSTSGIGRSIKMVFKMPTTYAAIFAFVFQYFNITVPESIMSTTSMVGDAAIPVMMIMLGMQLGSVISKKPNWQVVISGVVLKMVIAPILAFVFVMFVGMDPLVGTVLIIISAMPTAATTTMYAIEFDTEPELVSMITLISTLLSIISLSILLNVII
ncbi:transporter [Sporosarcina sp. P12(2017)]|uniref:AEC family transporter n=1 Tax=unclassified Sporosarcina TaxID=2647733 RepID=UPI000C170B43|nr:MULTISPECIES: AEC family transporter [unclassified Sporosarcina]PIC56413.1 transporter [Sporosarcina sp. P10]PIC59710.1 transporter [Sporosarcina sp. P12(2017)]